MREFWQIISAIYNNFWQLGCQDAPLFARLGGGVWMGLVGLAGSKCDNNAVSVQLQLQLPAGTELGNFVALGLLR